MPRSKDNYHNSKIYGIYNENNRLIYIGHTTINLQSHNDVIIRNSLMKLDVRALLPLPSTPQNRAPQFGGPLFGDRSSGF